MKIDIEIICDNCVEALEVTTSGEAEERRIDGEVTRTYTYIAVSPHVCEYTARQSGNDETAHYRGY